MSCAGERLALTPELMELVFVNTDFRTLLVSGQRVCKTWRDIIRESHEIQRAMFFEPVDPTADREAAQQSQTVNPLLAKIFPPFFKTAPKRGLGLLEYYTKVVSADYGHDQKPFAFMDYEPVRVRSGNGRSTRLVAPWSKREAFLRAGASWRRMLVQQPAAPNVGYIEVRGPGERVFYSDIIEPKPGAHGAVTMGMLYDIVYCFMGQKKDKSRFCVYWRDARAERSCVVDQWYDICEMQILSGYPEDVDIVVIRQASHPMKDESGPAQPVSSLLQKYRPVEMKAYNPELVCMGGEDWFG